MAVVLCSALMGCTQEDTKAAREWRILEPRLSDGAPWSACTPAWPKERVTKEPLCNGESLQHLPPCTKTIVTHEEARQAIVHEQQCIAFAIIALKNLDIATADVLSDLAAAYYVQAQVQDRPVFLLDAWEAAQQALAVEPGHLPARFNLALIQEAIGRTRDAESSWDRYQSADHSDWGKEARQHRDRLHAAAREEAAVIWPEHRKELGAALEANNRARVGELIRTFPTPAEQYLEEVVIPRWAASGSPKDLAAAQLLASEVSREQGDAFALDVVAALANVRGREGTLKKGIAELKQARDVERIYARENATTHYRKAQQLLDQGGSPLRLLAQLGLIVNGFLADEIRRAETMLDDLERQAPRDRYPYLSARIVATRAYIINDGGAHVRALDEYRNAQDTFERLQDFDQVAAMQTRRAGVFLDAGQKELAWREAAATNRYAGRIVSVSGRHNRLGEIASTALELEHSTLAYLYQNDAVDLISAALRETADLEEVKALNHHQSIALRSRARIEVELGQLEEAKQDLDEAVRLAEGEETTKEARSRKDLLARIHEAYSALYLRSDPERAITELTAAIKSWSKGELPTLRTSLLSRRAQANRRAGHEEAAKADFTAALKGLDEQERIQLASRNRGGGEDLWSLYFDRFRETYRQLIELLIDEGKAEEAFNYAERAKAFEPLDLVRDLPFAPRRFERLTAGNRPIPLAEIRAALPPDTFLFEYCVLEDKTIVWVVGRDVFEARKLDVRRTQIADWRSKVQEAGQLKDSRPLDRRLTPPFLPLLQTPLSLLPAMPDGEVPRIVIIPDGDLHGLPFPALRHPLTRRHLLEDAIVSADGSATLYVFSLLRDADLPKGEPSALLVGDPHFNPRLPEASGLERLTKGAQPEVAELARLYPRSLTRKDDEATAPDFVSRAPDHEVIHVAVHGVVNEVEPSRSFLLFAPEGDDTGVLEAQKLLQLRLPRTRLVVLASCSSAGGAPVGPEGVAPLVRSFTAAGVPGVVGSLWEVNDATTKQLLVSFHRRYRESGGDAAKALRDAQLEVLNKKTSTTRMWAPFEVIGYASSPLPAPAETKEKPP